MSCSRARGCHGERLETFDVQVRPFSFYETRDDVRFGELSDCPAAQSRIFLTKTLGSRAAA
ncbi:hypothetical protein [Burkholderia ambifaria]|uniref:hypothetical protein n=1 Tax=Burkholderia ambifaria TaxID=152480 RepID=UPI00158B2164|nr:hypothetical protein [Burkholderia ambifaria]